MNAVQKKSEAQLSREKRRSSSGKFRKHPCDLCGKGCPLDYFSDSRSQTNGGFGLTLHEKCADKLADLSDEEYTIMAAKRGVFGGVR